MPNGGVPINLEFWAEPLGLGDLVWHQHGRVLNLRQVTRLEPLTGELVGSLEIQPDFLRVVVRWLLDENVAETNASQPPAVGGLKVRFEAGVLTVASSDDNLLTLSGPVLHHVASFMAYWVDHDAKVVPGGLMVEYPMKATDAAGQSWRFNHAF